MITLIENAKKFPQRTAVKSHNKSYDYGDVLEASENVALFLLEGKKDLQEERVAFIVPPGFEYVSIQWGIWRAGGIAVPLCVNHPLSSISYVLEDTDASFLIFSKEFEKLIEPLKNKSEIKFIPSQAVKEQKGILPDIIVDRRAMILYTSGTTGSPKGVVTTHKNIEAQIISLITSWEWKKTDHILNVLPLHHTHGIVNVLLCALWSGACCEFLPAFNPEEVFNVFNKKEVNVFMAVPTIYYQLIGYWDQLPEKDQQKIAGILKKFRLMVSGSAALPVSVMEKWEQISSHKLLERYGMTEIGMAISNPYRGDRKPGHIGQPLPTVQVRICDEQNRPVDQGIPGEIQVKGPNVFKEYWNKAQATREAFTSDGWFKSGDIAIFENSSYKILGRSSVDIIKSGGYKISALEIEEVLRSHPDIKDCGVVGIPDLEWGEIIAASLVLTDKNNMVISDQQLKDWLKDKLPGYKIPRKYLFQEELPRNVMGKVTKHELKKLF
ncbi:MAG: acyl-CoA synthetase [Cyclobacteriaceae bacterium]